MVAGKEFVFMRPKNLRRESKELLGDGSVTKALSLEACEGESDHPECRNAGHVDAFL